jgi:hypothetical protein
MLRCVCIIVVSSQCFQQLLEGPPHFGAVTFTQGKVKADFTLPLVTLRYVLEKAYWILISIQEYVVLSSLDSFDDYRLRTAYQCTHQTCNS